MMPHLLFEHLMSAIHSNTSRTNTHYLHPAQKDWIDDLRTRLLWRWELPTWLLIITIYSAWFGLVLFWADLNIYWATPVWIFLTAWYMSLQHELIHGHPTRFKRLNQLFGTAPLAVWYPYGLYRDTHIAHHIDENITHPHLDPEAYYLSSQAYQNLPSVLQAFMDFHNTFFGRLVFGPAVAIVQTFWGMLKSFYQLDIAAITMWLIHFGLLAILLHFLNQHGINPFYFVGVIAYPALSLTMVRSFNEHRAEHAPEARSVINEAGWFWRLLFLNLNYHVLHHDLPHLPWYGLRRVYLAYRAEYVARAQGFVLSGYTALAYQYAYQPVIEVVHPFESTTASIRPTTASA